MRFDHVSTLALPAYRGGSHYHYHYHHHYGSSGTGGGGSADWDWIFILGLIVVGICIWAAVRKNSED